LRSGPLAPVAVTVVQGRIEVRCVRRCSVWAAVEARQLHRIGPIAPGRLQAPGRSQVGDAVKAGQVLGEMDPVDSDDRLRSQEAVR
jgi:HlyD family secretion protein